MTDDVPTGPTTDHASYLGGTDIAALLGIHPYKTQLDVWAEKVHGVTTEQNEPMRIGNALERPVLKTLYAPPRGLSLWYPGTLVHPSEPWAGATPDALAGPEGKDSDREAECKIVGRRQMPRWGKPEDGPDGIPPEVLCQATWQLGMIRAFPRGPMIESADVVALLGTEFRVYGVAFDAEFFADLMETGRAWWRKHVEGGVMPEVYSEDSRKLLAKIHPKADGMLEMRGDVRDWLSQWIGLDQAERQAANAKAYLAAQVCAAIGDAAGFEGDGLKVTWSPRRGSIRYKAIVDALGVPEAEREQYRGEPTRVFCVTDKREKENT